MRNVRPLDGFAVLVAEDSWHLADALRLTIEGAGGTVAGMGSTLEDAETLAATVSFNSAVLDLHLHGEMTTALAERLAGTGIKVIVLTGYAPPAALAAKVHACISKPAEADAIITALLQPIDPQRASRQRSPD